MVETTGLAPKKIFLQKGMVRIPITVITVLNPAGLGLRFLNGDLPSPREISRLDKNAFIQDEGEAVGVETRNLGTATGAVGNGMQPLFLKELLGRHISAATIADMIQDGKFWGNFQMVSRENHDPQWQLQFRPGACPGYEEDGILRPSHVDIVCSVLRDNTDLVKVGGLWVNPKANYAALQSNLVLRNVQNEKLDHKPTPVQKDDLGYYIEVSPDELTAAGVVPAGVTFQ